jgi:hypothetical protein
MTKFRIMSHGRLPEWVAEEKGYFTHEGSAADLEEETEHRREAGTL